MSDTKTIIPIAFTKKQERQLRKEGDKIGESIATIVRRAVNKYFKER